MSDRMNVAIHGRMLGTASGWDGDLGECTWFYDFEPSDGVALPKGNLQYDEANGFIGIQNSETGKIDAPLDAPSFLASLPRNAH